jgi:hypothetical protein
MRQAKTDTSRITDLRMWCERCSIRIAPHEEKITVEKKSYHERCYSKQPVSVAGAKAVPETPRKLSHKHGV